MCVLACGETVSERVENLAGLGSQRRAGRAFVCESKVVVERCDLCGFGERQCESELERSFTRSTIVAVF